MYYVYILECEDGTMYTGITIDLERRFREHWTGHGGAYTRSRGVKRIIFSEKQRNRSSALKREAQIKRLRKDQKLALLK